MLFAPGHMLPVVVGAAVLGTVTLFIVIVSGGSI